MCLGTHRVLMYSLPFAHLFGLAKCLASSSSHSMTRNWRAAGPLVLGVGCSTSGDRCPGDANHPFSGNHCR